MDNSETKPLIITRQLNAPVEKVWAAWTEPAQLTKWWGPTGFTAPTAKIDLRVGGTYLFCMRGALGPGQPAQDFWSTGTYDEIVPLKRIVCSDSFADADGNVVPPSYYGMGDFPEALKVTVEFEDLGDGRTQMTLTHEGAPAGDNFDGMNAGWNQSFDKLAASLSS